MAGLGFKDFQVGEVLTSADVDGYLMQQSVMRFADSGARGSALGTAAGTGVALAEGMVSYLDDANQVQFYNGTGWAVAGLIAQVVQTVKTNSFSTTSTSMVDVTGMSATITPTSSSAKVLIVAQFVMGANNATTAFADLVRDSTAIAQAGSQTLSAIPNTFGAWSEQISIVFLDSPATTSATTYKLQVKEGGGGSTVYVGRLGTSADLTHSSLTVIEVAA